MNSKKFDVRCLDFLVCPKTGQKLVYDNKKNLLITNDGKFSYKISEGIPRLIVE